MNQDDAAVAFMEALNSRDRETLRGALSSDFQYEEVAAAGERSLDAFLYEMQMVFDAFPDIIFRQMRMTPEHGRVLVEFRAFGTHRDTFLNMPATGATVIVSGVFNVQGQDRLVQRLRMTVDFGGLRRQLLLASRTHVPPSERSGT